MKLSQIEQVLEVARIGNISQAAENLYLSQPALSLSIKRLETEVGTDIFVRMGNGVALTHFGEMFVRQARHIMAEVETMEKICQTRSVLVPLELRIGSRGNFNLVDEIFPEIIQKYSRNPIEIRWFDMDLDKQIEAVKNGDIEAGIITIWDYRRRTVIQKILSKGLEYRRIAPSNVGVFVSREDKDFIAATPKFRPEDIQGKPVVLLEAQRRLIVHLREHGYVIPDTATKIFVDDLGTMREAINATQGFGFATDCAALHPNRMPYRDVYFIPLAAEDITAEVGCILNKNTQRSVLADEVLAALTQYSC